MKRPSRAKALLVIAVLSAGAALASPNFFPSDPALQLGRANGGAVEPETADAVHTTLREAGLAPKEASLNGDAVLVRLDTPDAQQRAADALAAAFPNHVVAFTEHTAMPAWLGRLGLRPVKLGLDLRGGVHFLYEVGLDTVIERFLSDHLRDVQRELREHGIRASGDVAGDRIELTVTGGGSVDDVREVLEARDRASAARTFDVEEQPADGSGRLVLRLREESAVERQDRVMRQNVLTLRNRVNELGLAEPVVARSGFDRIEIQIPGARDPAQVRRILSSTATIEWHLQDTMNAVSTAVQSGRVPAGSMLRHEPDGRPVLLVRNVIASGEHLDDARFTYQEGSPVVSVSLNRTGARRMLDATQRHLGEPLAVLLIEESREAQRVDDGVEYRPVRDEAVIFRGRIASVFSSSFVLTGLDAGRAQDLAVLIRSGSLAAPIYEIRHGTVGPTLGEANIERGRNALVIGLLAVAAFMGAYYRGFGWIANCALVANLVLVLGLLSALSAALTLPGIAGIVLTVGMAVDANVLIFERIRESLANGKSPYAAIDEGYDRAFSTIADANVTTLIAATVLFALGTGPIRGFAVTLGLGVLTSMFTSIVGTRVVVDAIYLRRGAPKRLSIGGRAGES